MALGHPRLSRLSRAGYHDASLFFGALQYHRRLLHSRPREDEEHDPDLVHCLCCCGWWGLGVRHCAAVLIHPHGAEADQAAQGLAHAGLAPAGVFTAQPSVTLLMMTGLLYWTLPRECRLRLYPAKTQALPWSGGISSWETSAIRLVKAWGLTYHSVTHCTICHHRAVLAAAHRRLVCL